MTDHSVPKPTELPAWQALSSHAREVSRVRLRDLVGNDAARFTRFTARGGGIELDYAKQHVTDGTIEHLIELATQSEIPSAIEQLFSGALRNSTENTIAHHTRLRADEADDLEVNSVIQRIRELSTEIRRGTRRGYGGHPISDIVHIGIGGSGSGPALVFDALRPVFPSVPRCHFVANADVSAINDTLRTLDPESTLFVVVSKSFSTPETLLNARRARTWFMERGGNDEAFASHFIAVTAHRERAHDFGIDASSLFPMWDWVGGRFSVWSAAGLVTLAIGLGWQSVDAFVQGAGAMDTHFRTETLGRNLPLLLALFGVWNCNFLGASTHAVIPYAHRLRALPAYLQQLEMESNGKSVHLDGSPVHVHTAPVVWGGEGTVGQHAFHQLLMQGTRRTSIDFVVPRSNADSSERSMLANCLAQSEALLRGRTAEECESELPHDLPPSERKRIAQHQRLEGDRASNLVLLEDLSPRSLGALLALYEHKVFCQGIIWNVNSFDQWGVELGKRLAQRLEQELDPDRPFPAAAHDPDTAGLIRHLRRNIGEG
jgi:glucose-6-phosphate isomerase